jgi:hypothetical protein
VISLFWLVGLPIYLTVDSNRRADEFYKWCQSLGPNISFERTAEQQHEICWRSARFITPKVMAHTLIAGNADTVTLWSLMLAPVAIFWFIGGIVLATLRLTRRGRSLG